MLETRKLTNHKSSQCHVTIEDNGTINFISYTTLVIQAVPHVSGQYVLFCTGTYSQTTRKQIGWFLKEYFGDVSYYDMKNVQRTEQEYVQSVNMQILVGSRCMGRFEPYPTIPLK